MGPRTVSVVRALAESDAPGRGRRFWAGKAVSLSGAATSRRPSSPTVFGRVSSSGCRGVRAHRTGQTNARVQVCAPRVNNFCRPPGPNLCRKGHFAAASPLQPWIWTSPGVPGIVRQICCSSASSWPPRGLGGCASHRRGGVAWMGVVGPDFVLDCVRCGQCPSRTQLTVSRSGPRRAAVFRAAPPRSPDGDHPQEPYCVSLRLERRGRRGQDRTVGRGTSASQEPEGLGPVAAPQASVRMSI